MLDFIINGIFWVLALYGLFEIIKNIIYIWSYTNIKSEGIYIVVATKNQEEKIEGFLRTVLFRMIYGREECIKELIVTDLDSNDNTSEILDKLSLEYNFIKSIKWKDCKKLMDHIDES